MAEAVARPLRSAESNALAASRSRMARRHLSMIAVVVLTVLALSLRVSGVDRESLWLDEGYTLFFSRLSLPRLILVGGAHEHPPLYYLLVHVLLAIRNWYLVPRLISSLAGTLSVPVVYAIGARLYGRLPGLVAALLVAISPFHLWYSQDGRAYETAGLFVLLSYLTLFAALDGPRYWSRWALYSVCLICCLYTEYTTLFVLMPQVLVMVRARAKGAGRHLLAAWGASALLFAPWAGMLALDTAAVAQQYWIPPPTWQSVVNTGLQFLGMRTPCPSPPCHGSQVAFPLLAGHEGVVVAGVIAVLLATLGIAAARRNLTTSVLLLWLLIPFALVLLIGIKRPLYLDRVFLDATFPLYLLLGAAYRLVHARYGAGLLLALPAILVAAASVAGSNAVASTATNPDWRPLARDLAAAYRPGQAVVFVPGVVRTIVDAYLPPGWRATREQSLWYRAYLDVIGGTRRYAGWTDARLRDLQLREVTAGERQVWLVTMDYTDTAETRQWMLDRGYHLLLSELYSGDTRLELWDRGTPRGFGPAVLPAEPFGSEWRARGRISRVGTVVRERAHASLSRSFPVTSGVAYAVNVEWRSNPPAYPQAEVQTFDRAGRVVGSRVDRYGHVETTFPRTQWYSLPATGIWLSQPFGFVAPPGAVRATIHLENLWGETWWRNIAVYRER